MCTCLRPRPAQPLALLNAALGHDIRMSGTFLARCRLNPSSDEAKYLVLGEPRFQDLQGRHLRHLSGLHWVPACIPWSRVYSEATLVNFPNLESLAVLPGGRWTNSGLGGSE